jgi:thiol-disulfide isomerase/thioredoxin
MERDKEAQKGWWGRQTLLTRLLIISATLLVLSGYLVSKDLNRKAPDFDGATHWINSKPLRFADLQGKVILVDFWTLSCINCIRTFPYLKAWDEKYRDQGLVIIGVHAPEFAFEQSTERVKEAVAQFGLLYPIAIDNNQAIWAGFSNHWWPHKYLIDSNRKIRNEWIGEGAYDEVERAIQRLLAETRGGPLPAGRVTVEAEPVDTRSIRTPEIYFGYSFVSDFGTFALGNQTMGQLRDETIAYTMPDMAQMAENFFYLSGNWKLQPEKTELMESEAAQIILSYEAKTVNMVADPSGRTAIVYVLRNGQPLDRAVAGADVQFDERGRSYVEVDRGRMYRLINDPGGYGRHRIHLQTQTKGFSIYTLTFG